MHLEKHCQFGGYIRQLDNVSGRALERGKRCGGRARTTCRSQGIRKGEHFSRRASIKGPKIRCSAVPVHPKAAVAGCLAMPSSAYNEVIFLPVFDTTPPGVGGRTGPQLALRSGNFTPPRISPSCPHCLRLWLGRGTIIGGRGRCNAACHGCFGIDGYRWAPYLQAL